MISGPWGIGKTFLVRDFWQHAGKEAKEKHVYVSLYGLSTFDEIDSALFTAMHPILGSKAAKSAARVGKTVLKNFRYEADIDIRDVINKFQAELYVFDDLERCAVPIDRTLGYIN
jgi:hypothetical protein